MLQRLSSHRAVPAALYRLVFCAGLLAALAGCGGMADDPDQNGPDADHNVIGTVTFDFVPTDTSGSVAALDYGATERLPARYVVVEAVSVADQSTLASAVTDDRGRYALDVARNTNVFVRVKAKMAATDANPLAVTVADNTAQNAQWATDTDAFNTGDDAVVQDVNAGSGWTGTAYDDAARAGGPFAILDTLYRAVQKVVAVDANASFPALTVYWSPANIASTVDDPATGQIGTSHFEAADNEGDGARLFVLGKADNDTDEYDRHVIAHELGHYLQNVFSRDDSPGGSHAAGDMLDMRVAFSEGWGNAWSAIALDDPVYTDTLGLRQADGSVFDVAAGADSNAGWFNEDSVGKVLWQLDRSDAVGFAAIWGTLTTGLVESPALSGLHSFSFALAEDLPEAAATLADILADQRVVLPTDPYGTGEVNFGDPSLDDLNPIYVVREGVDPVPALCVSNARDAATDGERAGNRAGEYRYLLVNLPARPVRISVATRSTQASFTTPLIAVFDATGKVAESASDNDGSQNLVVTPALAGDHVITVTDLRLSEPGAPSARSCFDVSID